jgi:hypothetical protein
MGCWWVVGSGGGTSSSAWGGAAARLLRPCKRPLAFAQYKRVSSSLRFWHRALLREPGASRWVSPQSFPNHSLNPPAARPAALERPLRRCRCAHGPTPRPGRHAARARLRLTGTWSPATAVERCTTVILSIPAVRRGSSRPAGAGRQARAPCLRACSLLLYLSAWQRRESGEIPPLR